jgi:hypothetical protein
MQDTPMLISEVARALERSVSGVIALDDVLKPERTALGVRIYSRRTVERYRTANPGKVKRGRPARATEAA